MQTRLTRRCCLLLPAAIGSARAASWPERPVRLITSGAAGSGLDLAARLLAEGLSRRLGQSFTVENRPGANMLLAGEAHATARPGEALLLAPSTIASTVPFTQPGRLPFDPVGDLLPVAIMASEFLCLAVHAAVPAAGMAGLLQLAGARPDTLNWYSVPGFMELAFRLFQRERGLELTHVAYRGSPPAVLDLAAGRIQLGILPLTPLLGAIREGKVRPLAVTSSMRAPALPEVPGMAELGLPALAYDPSTALFGWRGMAAGLRDSLAEMVAQITATPEVSVRLGAAGMLAQAGRAADLARVVDAQRERVRAAISVLGPPQG
ncbi:tripartite tricarboxylate transporter substrate binding protein [Sediminicoccus sp. KRV36]|uniref:Bug family tripartite tricarboxylate transporter substrate binding protein n=1 Tax=Sediminicoccus sp. KRV36 TaxID=3133721 RepID=UPI00200D0D40|nr:tripartite tricarboxylate transporter substrate binding protein [Sediminicoccus rosea]UPY37401.1 tripartite tricarboxylate transporter substrate binding protein [Sediminicoccus rosea]